MTDEEKQGQMDIETLIQCRLSRRQTMQYGLGALFSSAVSLPALSKTRVSQAVRKGLLGFKTIPIADLIDEVIVPEGYEVEVFYRWGDPISDGPAFKMDASNTAQQQLQQAGMHHDALQFYPLADADNPSEHGLLVMNHEYIDAQILHADGGIFDSPETYTLEKTLKEQYAHGVSVIEVKKSVQGWHIIRPSQYARRITATTPMSVSGPVAGTDYIKTAADPEGEEILGTVNNCSNGKTPWGTYLTCEENFNDYFFVPSLTGIDLKQQDAWQRYDIKTSYYGWHKNDQRFNASLHPNEPNRFGWIVEFDPFVPNSKPVKRTAMGRFSHENVAHNIAADGRVAFYSGDDAKFEYVYKFITQDAWDGTQGPHNSHLLDKGILYVGQFNEDGSGRWLPLVFGQGPLTGDNGFDSQADVLVHARKAADTLGATPMDRPEWITTHPESNDVYVSMTNNNKRGKAEKAEKNAANPRNNNQFGHIIKLVEEDASSISFNWDVFVLAGDEKGHGTINGEPYANPDGLMIDSRGVLWVQTDISASKLNSARFSQFGNNQMLAVDPATGETRRFLTGPIGCEITGVAMTPDLQTMWVNIQHPGEDVPEILKQKGVRKTVENPNAASNWPDKHIDGRPRSATVIIRKQNGGVIGA